MAVTRNDWDVIDSGSSDRLVNLQWITGKVRKGDAHTVLDELGRRFNAEVEKITKAHSWGYAKRPVRGYASIASEHSAGTAVDFNAPAHPIGKANTFTPAKRAKIRRIVKDFDGAVRWGGEWSRPDDMHFELIGGAALLAKVAAKIRGDVKPAASKPAAKPKPAKDSPYKAWVKTLQRNLNLWKSDLPDLREDGDYGTLTRNRIKEWQRRNKGGAYKGIYIDGDAGPLTTKGLGIPNAPKK